MNRICNLHRKNKGKEKAGSALGWRKTDEGEIPREKWKLIKRKN